ncbi:MAG: TRAP transporter fused permease subunit [Salinisphaeraceae bacterium]
MIAAVTSWFRTEPVRYAETKELVFPNEQRQPGGVVGFLIMVACIGLALFTLWQAFVPPMAAVQLRAIHLAAAIPLIFLLYPLSAKRPSVNPRLLDWLLAALACAAFIWVVESNYRFERRFAYYDPIETLDLVFGIIAILVIFEATRRTVGWAIVILNTIFILYALTGPYWPGLFEHRGSSPIRLVEHLYMLSDGIFNFIMGITATFLFTFLMFGAFLRVSGGDRIFTDLALAIAGGRRGGPAKVAIISSALMGMLSGSTVSNVATTGTMTIPLMKRTGFKPYEAAAIESTASLGGALTPPLMGAGVFIMSAFTGVPLLTIMLYSIVPAVLYYISLYCYIDIKARKKGLAGLPSSELPKLHRVLLDGGHIFLPIIVLIYLLSIGYTPFFASAACVVGILFVSWLRSSTRMTPKMLMLALHASTRVVITISALSASAAMIYGVITMTGLLGKVSSIILALSGGSLFFAIILIGLMSYVLGMGLPVTAAYVLIAALGAPALGDLGISILAAHLIIFWFSQDSTITPPICMTAFVAARIAKAPPMRTGWEAVKMAKALYVVPFMFAYSSLLSEDWVEVIFDALPLAAFFAVLPMIIEGHAHRPLSPLHRTILVVPPVCFIMGTIGSSGLGIGWFLAGLAVMAAVLVWAHLRPYREPANGADYTENAGVAAAVPAETQSKGVER